MLKMQHNFNCRIGFATGSGRCATNFLSKLFAVPGVIKSSHERMPLNDTFHRYCKWYGIEIDPAGFIEHRRRFIENDLREASYSFEASPFLALSIPELLDAFNCKIVVLVRNPVEVVSSYLAKDWYLHREARADAKCPPSFQRSRYFHHFLGRISPLGDEFLAWNKLTRVGKLAWYWNAINLKLMEQVETGRGRVLLIRLEDLDYKRALEMHQFLGMPGHLSEKSFIQLRSHRPNALCHPHPVAQWSDVEWEEFSTYVEELARELNYELRRPKGVAQAGGEIIGMAKESAVVACGPDLSKFRTRIRAGLSVMFKGANSSYLRVQSDLDLLRKI